MNQDDIADRSNKDKEDADSDEILTDEYDADVFFAANEKPQIEEESLEKAKDEVDEEHID